MVPERLICTPPQGIPVESKLIQDLKSIKNVKGCRDGMPKSICKQGRDDIIVKVNLQSLIPASFSH